MRRKLLDKVEKIILAGDAVKRPNLENFLQVKNELANFSNNLIVAPGNHDFFGTSHESDDPDKRSYDENKKDFLKEDF